MALDILNYPEVEGIARRIVLPDSERSIGLFLGGHDQSMRIGDGFEIDGLHDYQPGVDEARHIDWPKSAGRSDGGMWVRDHYDERAPLTVMVSDIPSDRLARAYGTGDQLSARGLGFVASHLLLQANKRDGAPVLAVWSGGNDQAGAQSSRVFEDSGSPRKAIEAGLVVAHASTNLAQEHKVATEERSGLLRRRREVEPLPNMPFAEVLERAFFRAKRISSVARFVIVSDYRDAPEDIFDSLGKLRNNEVITVEVTNPHLRELPSRDVVMTAGTGKGVLVENDKQREEYKRKAAIRQAYITDGLRAKSAHTATVDTSSLASLRGLITIGQTSKR